MARAALTKTTALGAYGDYSSANAADITFAAGDVSNGNDWDFQNGDIILAWNDGGAAEYYVTVDSVDDQYNREGDITQYDVGIDEIAVIGPLLGHGWKQSDGKGHIDVENASIMLAVIAQTG